MGLVELLLKEREPAAFGPLERHGEGVRLALVAQIGSAKVRMSPAAVPNAGRISVWVRTAVVSCSRPGRTGDVRSGRPRVR